MCGIGARPTTTLFPLLAHLLKLLKRLALGLLLLLRLLFLKIFGFKHFIFDFSRFLCRVLAFNIILIVFAVVEDVKSYGGYYSDDNDDTVKS